MIIQQTDGRHIGFGDIHAPHQNPLDGPLGFAHDIGCTDFILGGDIGDCSFSSHWNEALFAELNHDKLREMFFQELGAVEKVVISVRQAIGKKARLYYIPGNHEMWLWHAVLKHHFVPMPIAVDPNRIHFNSDISALMDKGVGQLLRTHLNATRYDMTVLDYNEPLKIGKVTYLHGHQFSGQDPTVASVKRWPSINLVMWHHHTHRVNHPFNGGDPKNVHEHVICPGLCGLAPGYLKDKSTRWLNGFWLARMKDGLFDGHVVKVVAGKIIGQ